METKLPFEFDVEAVRSWVPLLLQTTKSLSAVERRQLARDLKDAAAEIEKWQEGAP